MSRFIPLDRISSWRRIAAATWDQSRSPIVLGFDDVDMSEMVQLLAELRSRTGVHVTVTHVVVKAVADVLARYPDLNVTMIRGRPMRRADVDIFVQVAIPRDQAGEADLSGVKIARADTLSVIDIAQQLASRASRVRRGEDDEIEEAKRFFDRVPSAIMRRAVTLFSNLSFDFGLDLSAIGVKTDPCGSAMVTNVGGFGVNTGFAPLVPFARTPIVLLLGRTEDRPVVRQGEIVARPLMRIAATFDHRLYDGYQIGVLSREIKAILERPDALADGIAQDVEQTIH